MAIQIKVGKNSYSSIASAWRNESPKGLPLITVRWRLKSGWSPEHAFWRSPIEPKERRKFKDLREEHKQM